MNEDEDIETLFPRFQVLVYGLQVLNKSYTTSNYVKRFLGVFLSDTCPR